MNMVHYIDSIGEFRSLLDYYISCLEKEDILSLTFNYRLEGKKFHSNIFKKEQFFSEKKEQIVIKKTPEVENIFKNYKLLQRNMPVFYGYPLFMDSNGNVSPVFFVEIFFEEKEDSIILTKESVVPEFNHYILTKHDYNVEEINKLRLEIEEEDDFAVKLQKITELLNLDKKTITSELEQKPLMVKPLSQLINKAILYFGGRMGFTRGLVDELQKLKKLSQHQLESTSLGILFNKEKHEISENKKDLLEIFNLNESQEKAVKNAFSNNISVITGPPGTGKSQVVLNIVANAVWNDKNVLFASKNNRAVDVVNEKLKTILSKDLIVRMGSSKHRKNAKLQIYKLFQNKNSIKISSNFENDVEKINNINKEVNALKDQLEDMSKTNEEIEELQNQADTMAKDIPEKLYNQCKNDIFEKINKFAVESDIKNNFENTGLIKKIIKMFFPSFYQRKEQAIFKKYYDLLSDNFRRYLDKNIKLASQEIKNSLSWILLFKQVELLRKEIDNLKHKLAKSDSIYTLQSKIAKYQEEKIKLSRSIFENYWFKKLKKTSSSDENHVSRYIDASEKLERYIEDYSLWRQLVGEQENEIQEILSFLPIWVVTNLSAKNSVPLKENLFDLLIIDEASQCDIASALPLFYRAKQAVIIGDPKQLKHISLLRETEDKKIASQNKISELYLDYAYSKNSLYDIAERTIKSKKKSPILLNKHYRSYKDIINFSNEYFYDKKLNIMTDESKLIPDKVYPRGVKWIDIRGKTSKTKSPYNKEEAIRIINILKSFKKSKLKKISFGIVTLFRAQMELIADMTRKTKELKNMDITVGTTHRFQGDEKDIIIFSPAISQDVKQKTLNWIHNTTQLLNVAITRARSVLLIVGDKKKCREAGGFLKSLEEYAESKREIDINFDSPVEEKLFKLLMKEGVKILPQYETKIRGKKPYRLDFALFINDNKYDVEVDGDKAHSQKIESDILRDIHLRMDGWKVRRFQVSEINNNINKVMEEIKRLC
ncbi:AAA family ATPase [Candidatus Woesearchaeota archaeon]|nr:AAA family ATPase [Candidatus Woesearchaeota archaeon]